MTSVDSLPGIQCVSTVSQIQVVLDRNGIGGRKVAVLRADRIRTRQLDPPERGTDALGTSASELRFAQARSHTFTFGTHVPTARTHLNTIETQIVRSGRPFPGGTTQNGHGVTSQPPPHPSPCNFFPSPRGRVARTTVDRMARARVARKKTRILNLADLESASSFTSDIRHQREALDYTRFHRRARPPCPMAYLIVGYPWCGAVPSRCAARDAPGAGCKSNVTITGSWVSSLFFLP